MASNRGRICLIHLTLSRCNFMLGKVCDPVTPYCSGGYILQVLELCLISRLLI